MIRPFTNKTVHIGTTHVASGIIFQKKKRISFTSFRSSARAREIWFSTVRRLMESLSLIHISEPTRP